MRCHKVQPAAEPAQIHSICSACLSRSANSLNAYENDTQAALTLDSQLPKLPTPMKPADEPTCQQSLNEYAALAVELKIEVLQGCPGDTQDNLELQCMSRRLPGRIKQILQARDEQLADPYQQRVLKCRNDPARRLQLQVGGRMSPHTHLWLSCQ